MLEKYKMALAIISNMDNKKEYIQIAEKDISLDDYPFFKLICIIGFTYGGSSFIMI